MEICSGKKRGDTMKGLPKRAAILCRVSTDRFNPLLLESISQNHLIT